MTTEIRALAKKSLRKREELEQINVSIVEAMLALPRGVTQTKMAAGLGISTSHLSMIFAGSKGFGPELIRKIAEWRDA